MPRTPEPPPTQPIPAPVLPEPDRVVFDVILPPSTYHRRILLVVDAPEEIADLIRIRIYKVYGIAPNRANKTS